MSADAMAATPLSIPLQTLVPAAMLVLLRISSAVVTAPVLSSAAIPARVKAALSIVIALLIVVPASAVGGAHAELSPVCMVGEVAVGLCFGLTFTLLTEALLFAGSLMSMSFSFSLANMMDPNSRVETDVLSTLFNWIGVLVLLGAGLHRTMLAALLRTFTAVPLGHAPDAMTSAAALIGMMSGVFFAALQLAAPVISAGLVIEVVSGMLSRLAPSLPTQAFSVPIKAIVSYCLLIGTLAVWPGWIEARFVALLDSAQKVVHA